MGAMSSRPWGLAGFTRCVNSLKYLVAARALVLPRLAGRGPCREGHHSPLLPAACCQLPLPLHPKPQTLIYLFISGNKDRTWKTEVSCSYSSGWV